MFKSLLLLNVLILLTATNAKTVKKSVFVFRHCLRSTPTHACTFTIRIHKFTLTSMNLKFISQIHSLSIIL